MKARKYWSCEEEIILRTLYPDVRCSDLAGILNTSPSAIYNKAHSLGLKKSEAFWASDLSARIQRGHQHPNMVASRIKPGSTPWNKGLKGSTGVQDGCRATQFSPGSKPRNTQPIGSLRVNKDGHLQQKISDRPGNNNQRWRGVAEIVWCATHGPVPPKHLVVFKRGQFTAKFEDITLDRVECISMADNARRNHPRTHSPELGRLVQLKGAISRQVNRIAREQRESQPA